MQNNIDDILANAMLVKRDNLNEDFLKNVFVEIKKALELNKTEIELISRLDQKHNNGFLLDFNVINNIFDYVQKDAEYYGNILLSEKDNDIIYGKQIFDVGNVLIINNGNTYTILELILRNLMVGNAMISCNNGYMYETNQFIIGIIQTVLESFNLSKYFVQSFIDDNYEDILDKYSSIDLVICTGDHELQQRIISKCKNNIIISGYESFDVYIESDKNIDFLRKLNNLNIQYFINASLDIVFENSIIVTDIDEAIAQINYNGSGYASTIFTDNNDNAAYFIKNVKSKIVTVNTSPSIERLLDIKQRDLYNEKTVIYPNNYKYDGQTFKGN